MSRWVWWADSESASTDLLLHEGCFSPCPGRWFSLWDLAVFLEGLKSPPFEPLQGAELKLKTVLLFTLNLAKHIRAIRLGSASSLSCTQFFTDDFEANLAFYAEGRKFMLPTSFIAEHRWEHWGSRACAHALPSLLSAYLCGQDPWPQEQQSAFCHLVRSPQRQRCHEAAPLPLAGRGDRFDLF